MSDTTDVPDDLVAAAMTGDRQAVGRVLTIIRPLVVRYCRARLGAPAAVSGEGALLTVPITDPDRVTDLLVDLRDAGVRLAEFGVQKPTLDEVFLTITGRPAGSTDQAGGTPEKDKVLA